jgi:hypothetical protein
MPCPALQALWEMERRGIKKDEVNSVLNAPEQKEEVRSGRCVYQSRLIYGEPPKLYLLRVFVEIDRMPPEVVTVYRTSKVKKYWR